MRRYGVLIALGTAALLAIPTPANAFVKRPVFLIAIPGFRADGGRYLHSHMLGVTAEYRDHGLGRRLKLEQRREARSGGLDDATDKESDRDQ